MFRRPELPISTEDFRGAVLLLMSIDAAVQRIADAVAEDDGEEEEEQG